MRGLAISFRRNCSRDRGDGSTSQCGLRLFGDGILKPEDEAKWRKLAEVCMLRRAHSPERLLDQTTMFLHRNIAKLPDLLKR